MVIRLQDIVLQAHHGVFAQEREQGNTFKVSVSIDIPETLGVVTDELEDTIHYQTLYDVVVAEMRQPSNLIEHVAGRIRAQLVRLYPEATVHVQVSKKNPPLGGEVAWATVEL